MPGQEEQLRQRTGVLMGRVLVSLRPWAAQVRLLTELTVPQLRALLILHGAGPLRMSDVAARLDVGFPVATGLVSKLVDKGLAARQHSLEDRRVVMCSCTESGSREAEQFWDGCQEQVKELLAGLGEDELEVVVRGMELLASAGQPAQSLLRDGASPLQPASAKGKPFHGRRPARLA